MAPRPKPRMMPVGFQSPTGMSRRRGARAGPSVLAWLVSWRRAMRSRSGLTSHRLVRFLGLAGLVLNLALAGASEPRPIAEHQLQALYLYNFTKYMEWPAEAFTNSSAPFTIGVLASAEVEGDLAEIVRGKVVNGRPIQIRSLNQPQDVKSCHVVFLNSGDKARLAPLLEATQAAPVLTVGVTEDFLKAGGMIAFARKDSRLGLKIDVEAAKRAGLTVSAKLLAVAETVHSGKRKN